VIPTAHDIATNLWSAWGLFIAAFAVASLVILLICVCRAAALGDFGPIDTRDVLDDLMDGDTWATQQYLAGNLPDYLAAIARENDAEAEQARWDGLWAAIDFETTRREIAALPETRKP